MPAHPRAGNFRRVTSQIFPVVDVQGKEAEPLSYVRFINLDRLLTNEWDVAEGSEAADQWLAKCSCIERLNSCSSANCC